MKPLHISGSLLPTNAPWAFLPCLVLLLCLFACAPPAPLRLPGGLQARVLGRAPGGQMLRFSPDGQWLAVAGEGAILYAIDGSKQLKLAEEPVPALRWKDDGERLEILLGVSEQIQTLNTRGEVLESRPANGIVDLPGAGDGPVIRAQIRQYRFGGPLRVELHAGGQAQAGQLLYDNTLPPQSAAWLAEHRTVLGGAAVSPGGDLLAYLQFRDPPAFPPAQQLWVRHLPSGRQWPLATLPLIVSPPVFSADGESLFVVDGKDRLLRIDSWEGTVLRSQAVDVRALAVASAAGSSFVGGRLVGEGLSLELPFQPVAAAFSPDGHLLAWLRSGRVEVIDGLPDAIPAASSAVAGQLRQLRDWRARDLIDATDYRRLRKRILNHD